MTPARLAAHRRNALQSTCPRTTRGKAQARLNGLRRGEGVRLSHEIGGRLAQSEILPFFAISVDLRRVKFSLFLAISEVTMDRGERSELQSCARSAPACHYIKETKLVIDYWR
jgi:hypothetical protein